jgi:5-methylcytosine-specific restriction endonuclease McrA
MPQSPEERRIKVRATAKAWAEAHPERVRANHAPERLNPALRKAQRIKHRDQRAAYNKQWRQNHRDKTRAMSRRRYARRRGVLLSDLTAAQWEIIKATFHFCCAYCHKKSQHLSQDHITPLSKGGNHTLWNIVPACRICNSVKRVGPPLKPVQPLLL